MSLLNTYTAANRVVENDLAIRYAQTRVNGSWSYSSGTSVITLTNAWSYTRTATKSYKYVGLTKTAADACAAEMREKYQRAVKVSDWNASDVEFSESAGGSMPMADVAVHHVAGEMWEVVVSVNESDSRLRINAASVATLFAEENARTYDED